MTISYGKFVGELSKGIEGLILAYDKEEPSGRCVIYLKGMRQKIFIDQAVIKQARDEALTVLRAKIRESDGSKTALTLSLQNGILVFKDGEPRT